MEFIPILFESFEVTIIMMTAGYLKKSSIS